MSTLSLVQATSSESLNQVLSLFCLFGAHAPGRALQFCLQAYRISQTILCYRICLQSLTPAQAVRKRVLPSIYAGLPPFLLSRRRRPALLSCQSFSFLLPSEPPAEVAATVILFAPAIASVVSFKLSPSVMLESKIVVVLHFALCTMF